MYSLGYGAYQSLEGKLTVGDLLVVMAYIAAVYKPLETITYSMGALQEKLMSLRIAFDCSNRVLTRLKIDYHLRSSERSNRN